MSESKELSIQGIIDLASAYYGSSVLFAALELDLFTAIQQGGEAVSPDGLAERVGCHPRGLRLLLDGCAALGLLRKTASALYSNTTTSAMTLASGGAHDLTRAIRYNRDVYPAWGRVAELARTGAPVEAPELHLGDDAGRTRRFALAMHGRALSIGRMVVPILDLAGCRKLLDLAGGPATYAVLIAEANPELHCVSIDLPALSRIAEELVSEAGMEARVTCRAGDYHTREHEPETYDAVTIFGALHQETPAMIVRILTRACAALKAGGRIFVLDMMTDTTRTQPAFSALFAINMALTTHHGWVFSDQELHGWLHEAGFTQCTTTHLPPPMPHWLVTARKPRDRAV